MKRVLSILMLPAFVGACNLPFGPTAYSVSSESMLPTLVPGDVVLAPSKPCRGAAPKPGDVVAYRQPAVAGMPPRSPNIIFMHRVVAGPGDRVTMKEGRLTINGQPVKRVDRAKPLTLDAGYSLPVARETLSNGKGYDIVTPATFGQMNNMPETLIPAGHWFILGDNRDNSLDSRIAGPVPQASICGVATGILNAKDPTRRGRKL